MSSLITNGAALPFTAHATSPTITMPRVKAVTTGSIPSFLDVILNFAESDTTSSLASQDTWLAQMKAKKSGKMIMYGDDTWLKLFPGFFDRADGTSSFFVSDFTEVDNNVTRHIPDELKNNDWNTMIMHYLGLDHIGHKTGPRGPNMIPKQREMDGIVRQIFESMEAENHLQSTLLVLCGDHGMNDAGNHGGSAPGETSPALVFISPKLKPISQGVEVPAPFQEDFQYYQVVEQSDVVPTLGALLGFPAPKNNLGAFIPDFLPFWNNSTDKVQILLRNAKQIVTIITATFPSFGGEGPSEDCATLGASIDELSCEWRSINKGLDGLNDGKQSEEWLVAITKWLKRAQELMSSTASNYDIPKLVAGQAASIFALALAFFAASPTVLKSFGNSLPILAITLSYGIMMFASSYVEEEQHFWYWTTSAWLMLLLLKCNRKKTISSGFLAISTVVILLVTRIARRWNQTGQKFAGEPDIGRTFLSEHRNLLWTLVVSTYLWNLQSLASRGFPRFQKLVAVMFATGLASIAITFKLAFTNEDSPELLVGIAKMMADNEIGVSLVLRARTVFVSIAICLLYSLGTGLSHRGPRNNTMKTIHDLLTLFLITQSRATNIPLLLLFEIQSYLLNNLDLTLIEAATTALLLQYMSFFAFGGSNAISSIDLSSAYNGVSGYNVVAVGILTFVSNWCGPVFWASAINLILLRLRIRGEKRVLFQYIAVHTMFVACSLLFVMVACTMLRTHLFIWTVFSPKYLYSMAWSLGQHLLINIGLTSLLHWLGGKYMA
ncbi:GPI ethanolamine phosphate transferas-like protein 2 [Coleophoma cylindrospora]|uniref:GPI ethanolamine phosphate transferase 2 n=1 Tax=Coleophoma cylindrospora TaxID=1849047 RepID=A0A3D8ST29_9HELO|nr:GPI ethanolamine phosphate transferas-like protein 2 [Coleophoma cylindrospora]